MKSSTGEIRKEKNGYYCLSFKGGKIPLNAQSLDDARVIVEFLYKTFESKIYLPSRVVIQTEIDWNFPAQATKPETKKTKNKETK